MSKFVVTVTEVFPDPTGNVISTHEVFKQAVESVDLAKLFTAINSKPRKARAAKSA